MPDPVYTSTWSYGDYDLDDIEDRLLEICLAAELTAWAAATDQTKDILLARAVEVLDAQSFRGSKYDAEQDELFPRSDSEDGEIPQTIIDAICLEAVAILATASASAKYAMIDEYQEHGVKSVRISGTGLQYDFSGVAKSDLRGGFLSTRAWALLKPYLARDVNAI